MSQYGMQMPGGRSSRGPSVGLIDALLLLSLVAMVAACAYMWPATAAVSPDGKPWVMHDDDPNTPIKLPE
ncbi:MAG: hypothetical protein NCW75_09140 [Phycisphaera sp.]|nr:MAG: hypothetical protein NCW75_09140 [Phycisphaera sp.]